MKPNVPQRLLKSVGTKILWANCGQDIKKPVF
uniref:Zinc-binding domain protein n=1 Tax=Myoviridae sp. ctvns3 TaxID=2825204 RepID=A0A8S5PE25_9CAUD|nr:MAG TPA: zinc-binding domain protein [Myoviridae sp. ctvns3]